MRYVPGLMAAILLAGGLALAAPANAGALRLDDEALVKAAAGLSEDATNGRTPAERAINYWTDDRQRDAVQATPEDALEDDDDDTPDPYEPTEDTPPAKPDAALAPPGARAVDWSATTGKVFFYNAKKKKKYVCSASALASPSKVLIATAGHCVHGGRKGAWHQNWVFVPSYKKGKRPFGSFAAKELHAFEAWTKRGRYGRDIAFVVAYPNAKGQKLVDVVGGHGLSTGAGRKQDITAIGYPAEGKYDGETQYSCVKETKRAAGWKQISMLCGLNGGSSGGPWLRKYDDGLGLLNGVTSNSINNTDWLRSPYFDGGVRRAYNGVKNLS